MGLGEVRPGYKRTEVGVIPEGWEVSTVGEHFEIQLGKMLDGARNFGILKPYINNVAVRWGSFDLAEVGSVPLTSRDIARYRLVHGDLLVCEGGEIGRSALWDDELPECYFQKTLHRLRSKACGEPAFFRYLLELWSSAGILDRFATQTSIAHLTKEVLAAMPLPVPERPQEQKLISDVLVSYERLLSQGEVLLAKKRDLKQAAMQELLRPRPEWRNYRMAEQGSVYGGLSGKTKADFGTGQAHYITFMSVMSDVRITPDDLLLVNVRASESQNNVKKGDLFFNASSETPEEVALCSYLPFELEHTFLNSFCFGFRLRDNAGVDALCLAYFFRGVWGRQLVSTLAQGAIRYNISKKAFGELLVCLPSLTDQRHIAAILTDMDAEIAALEERLAKFRDLKRGMMQNLLTGAIRLV